MDKNNQQQYLLEKQQRYLKFLLDEEGREEKVRTRALREMGKLPKEKKQRERSYKNAAPQVLNNQVTAPTPPSQPQQHEMSLTLDRYLPSRFRVYNVILDSNFRDTAAYPNANDFVVRLPEPLQNVAALRILRTEFYQPSNTTGYFVMNEVRIPLQLYNIESAYLYLNGYVSTSVANDTNTTFFGRIGPGTEMYPAVTGDITQDPFIYVLQPVEARMKRFHIKLLRADGSIYPVTNARVILNLAVYCFRM